MVMHLQAYLLVLVTQVDKHIIYSVSLFINGGYFQTIGCLNSIGVNSDRLISFN